MPSLLERTLGAVRKENSPADSAANSRRVSGGARATPYSRPDGGSWKHDRFGDNAGDVDSNPRSAGRTTTGTTSSSSGEGVSPKLMISNLHYEVSERELEVLFVQIGPIAAGPKIKRPLLGNIARGTYTGTLPPTPVLSSLFPSNSDFRALSSTWLIKFDRSGRSEGIAWVTYANEKDAAAAKEAFNGAFAKGEPIKVEFDHRIDRTSERGTPAAGSLLARVGAPVDSSRGPRFASDRGRGNGPRFAAGSGSGRAERGVGAASSGRGSGRDDRDERRGGGERGSRGGRGGAGGRRGDRDRAARKEPRSGGDLDAELEAFMKTPSSAKTETPAAASAPQASTGGDVEMA